MMNQMVNNKTISKDKKWEWNESDLKVDDISSIKTSALTRASKISPQVTCCTLGNKVEEISSPEKDNIKIAISNEPDNQKNKYNLKITVQNDLFRNEDNPKSVKSIEMNYPRKVQVLNYKLLNEKVQCKAVEKQRVEQVKQEQESRQKIFKEEDNKRRQIYEQLSKDREELIQKQIDDEKKLLEEIDQKTKCEQEKREKMLIELRKKKDYHLKMILIDAILNYQKKFKMFYMNIVKLMKSASSMILPNCEEYNKLLQSLVTNFDNLKQKVKNEVIGPAEVKAAENLCIEIKKFENFLSKEVENYEKQVDSAVDSVRNEMNYMSKQAVTPSENQPTPSSQIIETTAATDLSSTNQNLNGLNNEVKLEQSQIQQSESQDALCGSVSSEQITFYNNIMAFYTSKVETVKALQADESMKKYRFACQKAVTTPVNLISSVNPQHLQDKYDKIFSFITGNPLKTTSGMISVLDHPLGRDYCLLLLAKKIVGQGDSIISSNAQAAFPIASIVVSIWKNIPEFGLLFLAYSFKECPYLVPYFIPQAEGQTTEKYLEILGYRTENGVREKQDMYLKRQSGYMRLYAAIMITESTSKDTRPHPYGLENGWKWLSNLLNLEPLPDICATLMLEFLQIAGSDMWALYGNQFSKILLAIQQQYYVKLSKVDEGGPKSRLEVFLQKTLDNGEIRRPFGTLERHFW